MKGHTFLLIISIIGFCMAIHTHDLQMQSYNQKAELDLLKKQQGNFEKMVEDISGDLESLTKKLGDAGSDQQKVLLLQSSIVQQRRQIFNMSISILPQFNFSRCACENLTEEQKVDLLKSLDSVKAEIGRLQRQLQRFPKSERANQLRQDVEKQLFFVNSMREIILSKCLRTIIMSPTIFQTNLYAPNWILGNQTASQVVDEYYQRSLRYDNVTNCPVDRPFFNGQTCMTCNPPRSVFDLLERKCVSCGEGYEPNNITKKCDLIPIPVYASNYNETNYSLDGLADFPPRPADAVGDCPLSNPFFDGKKCIPCHYPTYFSIPNSICKHCPAEHAYDVNTRNCEKIVKNYLTQIDSKWVTKIDNYINIFHDRQGVLRRNQSLGVYHDCDADRPFYDGIACISCPQPRIYFNYDTNRCVPLPQGMAYDHNIHAFVIPLQNYQTMVNAQYIISFSNITDDPSLSKCSLPKPYFDGLTCIKCFSPNNLFDVQAKHCTKCNPPELYDKVQLKCVICSDEQSYNARTESCEYHAITLGNYEVGSYVNLTEPLEALIEQNSKKMSGNPNAKVCPTEKPYFNEQRCMSCGDSQPLFNHTSKQCTKCLPKEVYNPSLHVCEHFFEPVQLTNINAGNIIDLIGTIDSINDKQQSIISKNPKASICPIQTPYATKDGCISCKDQGAPLFSYSKKICTACQDFDIYNPKLYKCEQIGYLTNLNAPNIVDLGDSMENLKRLMEATLEESVRYKLCEETTPYYDGHKCIQCHPPEPLFSFKHRTCAACPRNTWYNKRQWKCQKARPMQFVTDLKSKNIILNDTMANLMRYEQQIQAKDPETKTCPEDKPYSIGPECITCPDLQPLFDYASATCSPCSAGTIYSPQLMSCQKYSVPIPSLALKWSKAAPDPDTSRTRYLTNLESGSIVSLPKDIKAVRLEYDRVKEEKKNLEVCPPEKPYSTGFECVSCRGSTNLWNLTSHKCTTCEEDEDYVMSKYECVSKYGEEAVGRRKGVVVNKRRQDTEESVEVVTTIKKTIKPKPKLPKVSATPQPTSNQTSSSSSQMMISNLNVSNWVVSMRTPGDIYEKVGNFKKQHPGAKMCPKHKPFLQAGYCINCPEGQNYDFDSKQCSSCPSGRVFDVNAHGCLHRVKSSAYQTNPTTAKNLILGGISLAQYESTYKSNEQAHSNIRDCPTDKPYYDDIACVKCYEPFPYFNMESKLCQNCGEGSTYNRQTKECEDSEGKSISQNPTLQKMLSSIF